MFVAKNDQRYIFALLMYKLDTVAIIYQVLRRVIHILYGLAYYSIFLHMIISS